MIAALEGKVEILNNNSLILVVKGVGYKVFTTSKLIGEISKNQKKFFIYVYTYVKEDALELYGFKSKEDLFLFELLLEVPGIGPKSALLIMECGTEEIRKAIIASDVEFFTSLPRIGKKNAQKIIIELKPKLGSISELDLTGKIEGETKEIIDALITMGFKRYEIIDSLKNLPKGLKTPEEKIKEALKILGGKG